MADTESTEEEVTVYVNADFADDYTDAQLAAVFEKCGTVVKATLLGSEGKKSGYGFVQFETEAAAQEALKLNNEFVGESRLGVVISTFQKPKQKKEHEDVGPGPTLFIRQLAWKVRSRQLKRAFKDFGDIKSCRVSTKGYGFVEFDTVETATKAMEEMNGKEIMGKEVAILYAKPRPPKKEKPEQPKKTQEPKEKEAGEEEEVQPKKKPSRRRLFLRKLAPETTNEQVREYLSQYGDVKRCTVKTKDDNVSCYVTMDPEGAGKARDAKTGEINGAEVEIFWAKSNGKRRAPKQGN